jgi:ribosomal protein S18 acetylase RimI-like enzyme
MLSRESDMQIRDFTVEDYAAATALWQRCGLHPSASDTPERLAGVARQHPGLFLLAFEGAVLVGSVMGIWDSRRGWINRLAVDPTRRRTGLGRSLLALVEDRLRERGCDKVNLLIETDNAAVADFYAAAGYVRDPLIFMEKFL